MKSLLFFSTVFCLSFLGYRQAEAARLPANIGIVAEFEMLPGFVIDPAIVKITVFASGVATKQIKYLKENVTTSFALARMQPHRIVALRKSITKIHAGDLIDIDAGGPICSDMPVLTWSVRKSTGSTVVISKAEACHRYEMPDSDEARGIKRFLEGLQALGDF